MFRWLLVVSMLVAVVAGMIIGILNPQHVSFNLLLIQGSLPLGALMLACFVVGFALAILLAWLSRWIRRAGRRA